MDAGQIGGIAGCVVGLMGGIIGTYCGIKSANGPRERAFAIWATIAMWLWLTAMTALVFLMPRPWKPVAIPLISLPSFVILVVLGNRWQARARTEDEVDAKLP